LLERYAAALCIYDLAGRLSPKEVFANLAYLRLHGPGEPYHGDYPDKILKPWARFLRDEAQNGRKAYCYFNNDQAGCAVKNALALQKRVIKSI
jgi:uncharacterized protein YecE (DUF72 family)